MDDTGDRHTNADRQGSRRCGAGSDRRSGGRLRTHGTGQRLLPVVACAAQAVLLGGCQGERAQSMLHPSSPAAAAVARLWWVLLAVLGMYSLAVFVLMLIAIFRRPPAARSPHEGRVFILVGGVMLPSLVLVPLLIYSVQTTAALRMRDAGLTIRVIGHRWWWEVEYPGQGIVTANEIYIPAGEPVRLELAAADVIHSFWVPELHGKMDMLPGHATAFWIQADRAGKYRGQCAEFCGVQHAKMALVVEALPPEEFVRWVERHQLEEGSQISESQISESQISESQISRPQISDAEISNSQISNSEVSALDDSPAESLPERGRRAFFRHGCAVCHAVAGTPAVGRIGPDLTWMGERQTIAAATLPNTEANLLAWLAAPQTIKPGVKMPATQASQEDLRAIVAYLGSLTYQGERE